MFCLHKYLFSDLEVWSQSTATVSRDLVSFLCSRYGVSEMLMEFIKVGDEVTGTRGSEFLLQMDGDVQMVTFISEEWRDACSSVRSIVIDELCDQKEVSPIVLLIITVDMEILLQGLIHSFCLSITFGVVTGGEIGLHIECLPKGVEKRRHELRSVIGGNVRWDSVFGEDVEDEQFR
jgi:hypothetical protein